MDHILEYESQPVPDLGSVTESSGASARNAMDVDDDEDAEALKSLGVAASGAVEAKVSFHVMVNVSISMMYTSSRKSIKCSECGKIFKNTALANFHAEKSGHDQFEESTEEVINCLFSYSSD